MNVVICVRVIVALGARCASANVCGWTRTVEALTDQHLGRPLAQEKTKKASNTTVSSRIFSCFVCARMSKRVSFKGVGILDTVMHVLCLRALLQPIAKPSSISLWRGSLHAQSCKTPASSLCNHHNNAHTPNPYFYLFQDTSWPARSHRGRIKKNKGECNFSELKRKKFKKTLKCGKGRFWGYYLFPYFGGNQVATHDIEINFIK